MVVDIISIYQCVNTNKMHAITYINMIDYDDLLYFDPRKGAQPHTERSQYLKCPTTKDPKLRSCMYNAVIISNYMNKNL